MEFLEEPDLEKIFGDNVGDKAVFRARLRAEKGIVPEIKQEIEKDEIILFYKDEKQRIVRFFAALLLLNF